MAPPTTKAILDKTGLPFALVATPFANTENDEKPIPEVDLGPMPPRCTRCRAYINASVLWGENGNVWTCNLCSMVNDTPPWLVIKHHKLMYLDLSLKCAMLITLFCYQVLLLIGWRWSAHGQRQSSRTISGKR